MSPDDEWFVVERRPRELRARGPYDEPGLVETMEGDFEVDEHYIEEHGGFYVVEGLQGETYPVAADLFDDIYRRPNG